MAAPHDTPATEGPVLHSIGDAAEAAGLSPQALRMWEERYGRPVAVRLPSGHRRYTDEQVRWLRRVSDALAHGHRAGSVVPLDDEALSALLAETAEPQELGDGPRAILDWVASYGADEIRAWLRARWDPENYLTFLQEEVAPLVVAVGRGWADGVLDVGHEHFLTEVLEDELRRLRLTYRREAGSPTVLFATLPDEMHGLGLHMTALGAAAHGLGIRILGVDTPIETIAKTAADVRPAVVAISVSLSSGGSETYRGLNELRKALPESIRLVAGGAGMQGARRSPRGVERLKDLAAWDKVLAGLA